MGGKVTREDTSNKNSGIAPSGNVRGFSSDQISKLKDATEIEQIRGIAPDLGDKLHKNAKIAEKIPNKASLSVAGEDKLKKIAGQVQQKLIKSVELAGTPGRQKEGTELAKNAFKKSLRDADKIVHARRAQEQKTEDDSTQNLPEDIRTNPGIKHPEDAPLPGGALSVGQENADEALPPASVPPAPPEGPPPEEPPPDEPSDESPQDEPPVSHEELAASAVETAASLGGQAANSVDRGAVANFLFSVWGKMIDGVIGLGGLAAPKLGEAVSQFKKNIEDDAAGGKPKYDGPVARRQKTAEERKEAYRDEAKNALQKLNPGLSEKDLNNIAYIALVDRMRQEERVGNARNKTEIEDLGSNTAELTALRALLKTGRVIQVDGLDERKSPQERIRDVYEKIGLNEELQNKYLVPAQNKLVDAEEALRYAIDENAPEEHIKALEADVRGAQDELKRADQECRAEIDRLVFGVEGQYEILANGGSIERPEILDEKGNIVSPREILIPQGANHPETMALARAAFEEGYHELVQDFLTGLTPFKKDLADYDEDERQEILDAARKDMRKNKTAAEAAFKKAKEDIDKKRKEAAAAREKADAEREQREQQEKEQQIKQEQERVGKEKQEKINNANGKIVAMHEKYVASDVAVVGNVQKAIEQQKLALAEANKALEDLNALGEDSVAGHVSAIMVKKNALDFLQDVISPGIGKNSWNPAGRSNDSVIKARQKFMLGLGAVHKVLSDLVNQKIDATNINQGLAGIAAEVKRTILDEMAKDGSLTLLTDDPKDSKFLNSALGATAMNLFVATMKKDPAMRRPRAAPAAKPTKEGLDEARAKFDTEITAKATEFLQALGIPQNEIKQILATNSAVIMKEL